MLTFVFAPVGGGKTTYLQRTIVQRVSSGSQDCILLVPEQHSFATERAMLQHLGNRQADAVGVFTFTRLAQTLLTQPEDSDHFLRNAASRAVYMRLALDQVIDQLQLYRKQAKHTSFVSQMLQILQDCKQAAVSPAQLQQTARLVADPLLSKKLQDIALCLHAYDALATQGSFDDLDMLTLLAQQLRQNNFFVGKQVFVDGFHGFSGQEYLVLEQILAKAESVTVALCMPQDGPEDTPEATDLFSLTRRTANQLKRCARKCSIPIASSVVLSENTQCAVPAIQALRNGLFAHNPEVDPQATDAVTLLTASDIATECRYIAATAKRLVREQGLRCREIAVIVRNLPSYEATLHAEFQKCGLPAYRDQRQPISAQPLTLLLLSAMEIAHTGLDTPALLRYLKTGLAGLSLEDISLLENYVYIWNIRGRDWTIPWQRHPEGYGVKATPDSDALLLRLNALRSSCITPLLRLRASVQGDVDALQYATALFSLLEEIDAAGHLRNLTQELQDAGETALAAEQDRVWNIWVLLLDSFAQCLAGKHLGNARFRELLELMLSTVTLGTIPQGLDEISIGQADRIRTLSPKVVFVAGLNEGVFPAAPGTSGALSDRDRQTLQEMEIDLGNCGLYQLTQERFYAYTTVCCASEQVYLSYPECDVAGEPLSASEVIQQVKMLLPNCIQRHSDQLDAVYFSQALPLAFEQLAQHYRQKGASYAALRELLEEQDAYREKLFALDRATSEKPLQLEDQHMAQALFGENLSISATRVEAYYKCPFSYFCQYGLNAKARKSAALDNLQRGTLLHAVLEALFRQQNAAQLRALSPSARDTLIQQTLTDIAQDELGLPVARPDIAALLSRNAAALRELLDKLLQELAHSQFQPAAFELEIGMGGNVPPYTLQLQDGTQIALHGKVDRMDLATIDGDTYVKIVDYKSSAKKLEYTQVFGGLQLQMLLYLFALCRPEGNAFGKLQPGGVLYQGLDAKPSAVTRDAGTDQARNAQHKSLKPSGLVLHNSNVILAMDDTGGGCYIPAKLTASGKPAQAATISLRQLSALQTRLDKLLEQMAASLHAGLIAVLPAAKADGTLLPCQYCDYQAVCMHEDSNACNRLPSYSEKDALSILDQQAEEDSHGKQ